MKGMVTVVEDLKGVCRRLSKLQSTGRIAPDGVDELLKLQLLISEALKQAKLVETRYEVGRDQLVLEDEFTP